MAAIDALLGILQLKNAEGLVLASGQVPALLLGGARTALTMPPLGEGTLQIFIAELLAPEAREALASNGLGEGTHDGGTMGLFAVRAKTADGKTSLTIKRAGRAAAPAGAAAAPAARAVAARPEPVAPSRAAEPAPAPTAGEGAVGSTLLSTLVRLAVQRDASDIILTAGAAPVLRVGGRLLELERPPIGAEELAASFRAVVPAQRWRELEEGGSADVALEVELPGEELPVRVRANVFRHAGGLGAALRPIWREVPTLESLNLPASLTSLAALRNGLVLVAGPTGAGKSTTLAALLEQVNRTRACHVITLEDPIEYRYPRRRAVIHQRELGTHVDSFASGLRAALRECPDIILVGELRDPATIRMALLAAETGHLVLATIHAGSAAMAVGRIVDALPEGDRPDVRQQLASTARAIITQQLVPSIDGQRVPVLEVLTVNHAVAAQIRDGRTHMLGTQIELGADAGMVPMERALLELARAGRITRQTALDAAPDRASLERLLDERSATRRP